MVPWQCIPSTPPQQAHRRRQEQRRAARIRRMAVCIQALRVPRHLAVLCTQLARTVHSRRALSWSNRWEDQVDQPIRIRGEDIRVHQRLARHRWVQVVRHRHPWGQAVSARQVQSPCQAARLQVPLGAHLQDRRLRAPCMASLDQPRAAQHRREPSRAAACQVTRRWRLHPRQFPACGISFVPRLSSTSARKTSIATFSCDVRCHLRATSH
mmetsp:Transcript_148717/g.270689  ORF Transcript_148717/g.270689 Transcript_148717/m.270689 type:complete len:211 (-) Transcript_148717:286-918(-)